MAGRGPQTFQKRQKEQQRKEKQQEKAMKRLERKNARASDIGGEAKAEPTRISAEPTIEAQPEDGVANRDH